MCNLYASGFGNTGNPSSSGELAITGAAFVLGSLYTSDGTTFTLKVTPSITQGTLVVGRGLYKLNLYKLHPVCVCER